MKNKKTWYAPFVKALVARHEIFYEILYEPLYEILNTPLVVINYYKEHFSAHINERTANAQCAI